MGTIHNSIWSSYRTFNSIVFLQLYQIWWFSRLWESVLLFEIGIAVHHFSGLVFSPILLFTVLLIFVFEKKVPYKTIGKRLLFFAVVGSLLSLVIVYPVIFSAYSPNVNIPHPSTFNYFQNFELFRLFFANIYGFFLLLIPFAIVIVLRRRKLWALLSVSIFFLILGLGGTTILPQIVFGQSWLGLTYERFGLFASLTFLPLFGLVFAELIKKRFGKVFLIVFLVLCLFFAAWVASDSYLRPRTAASTS